MSGDKHRILIVDDAATNIEILNEVLGVEYDSLFAMDGATALRLAVEQEPDLILLDVVMPGLDGHEVCQRLKADPRTRGIPVIFISGLSDESDEAKGLEIGAIDYITKPFSPPIVRARVRNHLQPEALSGHAGAPVGARRLDRHRQPPPLRRGARPRMAPLAPAGHDHVADHHRRRLLQGVQRQLRPCRRRRMPEAGRQRAGRGRQSAGRSGGALWRRGIRGDHARDRRGRRHRDRRDPAPGRAVAGAASCLLRCRRRHLDQPRRLPRSFRRARPRGSKNW